MLDALTRSLPQKCIFQDSFSSTGSADEPAFAMVSIQRGNRHTFPGTMARYILKESTSFSSLSIWLIWKDIEMPDEVTRGEELAAFKAELADGLDWETASQSTKEGIIYT